MTELLRVGWSLLVYQACWLNAALGLQRSAIAPALLVEGEDSLMPASFHPLTSPNPANGGGN